MSIFGIIIIILLLLLLLSLPRDGRYHYQRFFWNLSCFNKFD